MIFWHYICRIALLLIAFTCSNGIFAQSIPAIVIHGGAGTIERGSMSDSLEMAIKSALQEALERGYAKLEAGEGAMEAVEEAIVFLENCPHFNAGVGAVMNAEGRHELDASVMHGKDLQAGAVAGVTQVKNPIRAAIAVMNQSPHVLLAGAGAEVFAERKGLEKVENAHFTTPRIKARWEHLTKAQGSLEVPAAVPTKMGTVGAVAVDKNGNIAAGTSTGGMMMKEYGRIGDSPIIGAGTYADNATCGVSATGHGEFFIRIGVAKEISDQMAFGGKTLEEAAAFTLQKLTEMEAGGGIIALDKAGNVVMDFNTKGMYRGFKNAQGHEVDIYNHD